MREKLSILFVLIAFVCAGALFILPQPALADSINVRVSTSYDDAEERVSDGDMDRSSSDLELVLESSLQVVGVRFRNVGIPQGANITNAYIEFEVDETGNTNPCNITIQGEIHDNPGEFLSSDFNISNRTRTGASVAWSPPDWTTTSQKKQTPDISSVVQEIVNGSGWDQGDAMVFIFTGQGRRVAEAYDGESANAPLLHVEFTVGVSYTIAASVEGAGGTISPSGTITVNEGGTQAFTITPDGGYVVLDVVVDGSSVGPQTTYGFTNVHANHTIKAFFTSLPTYTINATTGGGGTISPSGSVTVVEGNDQVFTVTPNAGYIIKKIQVDGSDKVAASTYTFYNVTANHSINAVFEQVPTYTITASAGSNGSISPSGAVVVTEGNDQAFTITADLGYAVEDLLVDGSSVGAVTTYTFSNVTASHTIEASFVEGGIYTIISDAQTGGSISPAGNTILNEGESQAYTITPDFGNSVLDVEVDGLSVGAVTTYTFSNVTSGHSIVAYFNVSPGSCVDLATVPVGSLIHAAPPNIMFVFDDSGSMTNEYYTTESSGYFHKRSGWWHTPGSYSESKLIGDPSSSDSERREDIRMYWKSQWAPYSGLYYDPTHTFAPWPTMPNANPDNPIKEPGQSTSTTGLSLEFITFNNGGTNLFIPRAHYYAYSETESKPYLVIVDAGQIKYYAVTGLTGTGTHEAVTQLTLDTTPPTDVIPKKSDGTPRTYAEERQNFANYFSYYRRRFEAAKGAVTNVIASMQGVYMGFFSITQQIVQPVLPIRVQGDDSTQTLLDMIIAFDNGSGTPLRGGLQFVGRYFDKHDGYKLDGSAGDDSPWAPVDEGGECQQAFAVVMTDGFWDNDDEDNAVSAPGDYSTFQLVGNVDGDNNTAFDGPPYADSRSNYLADYAMYFYERDLNLTLANKVPTNPNDTATHQHLVTYGIAFGEVGDFIPEDYDADLRHKTTGVLIDWDDGNKIDDLWHSAVNGRGEFVVARNTGELVKSFMNIMQNIESRIGSASSVSVNGDELYGQVGSDIFMFQSTYNPSSWIGDVKAYHVDINSGEVITDSYIWSARTLLDTKTWTTRAIATYDPGLAQGTPFQWANLTATQKTQLNSDSSIVDFLRGDRSLEDQNGGDFRNRFGVLGDVVHSSPIFEDGYLYVGANDGMMHCLNAATGEEVFAYVPNLIFDDLAWQINLDYPTDHKYYVDLSPVIQPGVDQGGSTMTLLVGGLGKGGTGYYALDVTDPASMTTDAFVAGKVLWEYGFDDDLGYTYSKPVIVDSNDDDLNSNATGWVVITGNGYNSTHSTAVLFILDPFDGTVIKKIDVGNGSCNGLSTPSAIDADSDGKVDYVYAGDLKGNLWKFDLTSDDKGDWDVAYKDGGTPKPLFKTPGQPITTQPDVMEHCKKPGYIVVFGTGKYLGASDLSDTTLQSIYGVWDYGDDDDETEYLGTFIRGATPQLSNQPDSVTLLRQTYVPSTESDTHFWTVGSNKLRILTANEPDWTTTTLDGGAVCTAGLGVDGCDPNATGAHPDPVANAGWYFDLPIEGERVVSDVMIRENKVIVLSFIPEDDPCGASGTTIIHEIDACTGARLAAAQFDIDASGIINTGDLINIGTAEDPVYVAPSGILRDGRLQPPAILSLNNAEGEEMKYYSSSTGKIETEVGTEVTQGIGHWRVYR